MNTLSIDVWQHIFEFACMDGGRTGGSLARTSKAFRAVSAPFRFHSVELTTVKSLEKFLACHDSSVDPATKSESDPPHVRHLLLAFLSEHTDVCFLGPSFHFMDMHGWQQDKEQWNERFVRNMTRLLALIAPTLQTMTVLQDPEVLLPYVPCTLPALRELTLLKEDRMFLRASVDTDRWMEPSDREFYSAPPPPDRDTLATSPIFPALKKLHFVEGQKAPVFSLWSAAAPCLSELRLSNANPDSLKALHDLLRESPQNFASLRAVTVLPQPGKNGYGPIEDVERSGKPLNVVVLPTPQREERGWEQRPQSRWNSRAVILTWAIESFGF